MLVFVLGHSIISHKEFRFIWPVLPLVFLLIAEGFEAVCCLLRPRPRAALVGLFALSVAVGTGWRAWRTPWNLEPSRSSMVAMATVGTEPDLTGVALFGVPTAFSGNRFYLRRDVPFLVAETPDVELFLNDPNWKSGNINYLVTYKKYENLFSMYNPRIIKRCEKLIIYKIDSAPGMRTARIDRAGDRQHAIPVEWARVVRQQQLYFAVETRPTANLRFALPTAEPGLLELQSGWRTRPDQPSSHPNLGSFGTL